MQNDSETQIEQFPVVEHEGWNAEKLGEESSNEQPDEILRKMLRKDESIGDPDERDFAGVPECGDATKKIENIGPTGERRYYKNA